MRSHYTEGQSAWLVGSKDLAAAVPQNALLELMLIFEDLINLLKYLFTRNNRQS